MKICIVTPTVGSYSESFIKNHIERLPCETTVAHGPDYQLTSDNTSRLNNHVINRATRALVRRISGLDWGEDRKTRVFRHAKSEGVSVLLAEYGTTAANILPSALRVGLPLVAHFHGHDAYQTDILDTYREKYKLLFRKAAAIVAVSAHMKSQLVSLGAPAEKITVIPCGADETMFRGLERDPGSLTESSPTFLAVGRFVEKKAPYLTILAFKLLHESVPEARLIMVGNGRLVHICHQMIHALGLQHAVELCGAATHKEVADFMRISLAFVQHSIRAENGDSEGTPVAVMEAQMAGLPVIATRHAGITDVVIEGKTGLLVNEGDTSAMADAMIHFTKNRDMPLTMGLNARANSFEKHSLHKSLQSLERLLRAASK